MFWQWGNSFVYCSSLCFGNSYGKPQFDGERIHHGDCRCVEVKRSSTRTDRFMWYFPVLRSIEMIIFPLLAIDPCFHAFCFCSMLSMASWLSPWEMRKSSTLMAVGGFYKSMIPPIGVVFSTVSNFFFLRLSWMLKNVLWWECHWQGWHQYWYCEWDIQDTSVHNICRSRFVFWLLIFPRWCWVDPSTCCIWFVFPRLMTWVRKWRAHRPATNVFCFCLL